MISIPFSIIFGWAERSERRAEERNEALEDIAQQTRRRTHRSGDTTPKVVHRDLVLKDDRAVIIDNRQVNIYSGIKPREN